jgi:hypothetical protein
MRSPVKRVRVRVRACACVHRTRERTTPRGSGGDRPTSRVLISIAKKAFGSSDALPFNTRMSTSFAPVRRGRGRGARDTKGPWELGFGRVRRAVAGLRHGANSTKRNLKEEKLTEEKCNKTENGPGLAQILIISRERAESLPRCVIISIIIKVYPGVLLSVLLLKFTQVCYYQYY